MVSWYMTGGSSMRARTICLGLATAMLSVAAHNATALPIDAYLRLATTVSPVRLDCNPSRCLDTRTGAYTQSTCDRRGCRPIGGVVGYIDEDNSGRAYGPGRGYRANRVGRWECNASRCRDPQTGAYTESTCDYRGCRPSSGVLGYSPR